VENFGGDGYFATRVGKHGNEGMIGRYVKESGERIFQVT